MKYFLSILISILILTQCSRSQSIQLIHEIQGQSDTSPLLDQSVTIEGIVTGDFQENSQLNGFFVQEEDEQADRNDMTSEGIFVYAPESMDVSLADKVKLRGKVGEYYNMTQLEDISALEIVSSRHALPEAKAISLPLDAVGQLEKYENMRVIIDQELYVTNNYLLGRSGELTLSAGGRLMQPTNLVAPGPDAAAYQKLNELNQIIIDDGSISQNPDPVIFPSPALSAMNTIRAGDLASQIQGILTYSWSGFKGTNAWRIHTTELPVFRKSNPRPTQPPVVGGNLKIASFNVLNYFNGNGQGEGFPSSRGADSFSEFQRQQRKIIEALFRLDADIVGLIELENDGYGPQSAIWILVNQLNQRYGQAVYQLVDPGVEQIGTDEITVGLIYKPQAASLIGQSAILTSAVQPAFNHALNRPSLAQTFTYQGNKITVVVNHFKSKGSDCNDHNDPDLDDGQGNCNLTRTRAAGALGNWMQQYPTGVETNNILLLGDFNAYQKEEPVQLLESEGYVDLLSQFEGDSSYSYSFKGAFGHLDYAFSSNALKDFVSGAKIWHINADEPAILDYNQNYQSAEQQEAFYSPDPFRSSDHDPVLVGLEFPLNQVTGLKQRSEERSISIHPNPAKNKIKIYSTTPLESPLTIQIINFQGNTIWQQPVFFQGNNEFSWPEQLIQTGTYLIRLLNQASVLSESKLVIE
ncbi:MAG: ExeM/NucH family extracellular endonuclease [Candidatus Cyclobacteriaceae bacterium M3_2C_046]